MTRKGSVQRLGTIGETQLWRLRADSIILCNFHTALDASEQQVIKAITNVWFALQPLIAVATSVNNSGDEWGSARHTIMRIVETALINQESNASTKL